MFELLADPQAWVSLLVLSAMEIVLGIDNIVFISILCSKLPPEQQAKGRRLGLAAALLSRLALLGAISWVMQLTQPLFTFVREWSGKDLILALGGVFLLYKATHEIYENVEQPENHDAKPGDAKVRTGATFLSIVLQVLVLDVVFSLDSVITAVGMAEHIPVMVAAMLIAVGVMMVFAAPIGDFILKRPSVRILALSFLVLIAIGLIMEGTGTHFPKGYIYSAMAFSLGIELLHLRMRSRGKDSASV